MDPDDALQHALDAVEAEGVDTNTIVVPDDKERPGLS